MGKTMSINGETTKKKKPTLVYSFCTIWLKVKMNELKLDQRKSPKEC